MKGFLNNILKLKLKFERIKGKYNKSEKGVEILPYNSILHIFAKESHSSFFYVRNNDC